MMIELDGQGIQTICPEIRESKKRIPVYIFYLML